MSDVMTRKPGRVFYGWFALAGGMLIIFTVGGTFVNSFGVFLPVVSAELGWGRATLATALSLGIVAFGLPSPLWGVLVSRLGPRFAIILGNMVGAPARAPPHARGRGGPAPPGAGGRRRAENPRRNGRRYLRRV